MCRSDLNPFSAGDFDLKRSPRGFRSASVLQPCWVVDTNPENRMATCIGQTVFLKGTLTASEDIRIAGRVEGHIHLHEHVLTVQPTGTLTAGVLAKSVIVEGAVRGE